MDALGLVQPERRTRPPAGDHTGRGEDGDDSEGPGAVGSAPSVHRVSALPTVLRRDPLWLTKHPDARGPGLANPGALVIDVESAREFRLANAAKPGEEFFPGMRAFDGTLKEDLDTAARALGWGTPLPQGHGRSVAVSGSDAGAYPLTSTAIRVHADGSVTIMTGSTELGQGSHTVLPQIAAEELGVPFDKVRVVSSDTAITPYDRSTGASRTTTLMGSAARRNEWDDVRLTASIAPVSADRQPATLTAALDRQRGGYAFRLTSDDAGALLSAVGGGEGVRDGALVLTGTSAGGEITARMDVHDPVFTERSVLKRIVALGSLSSIESAFTGSGLPHSAATASGSRRASSTCSEPTPRSSASARIRSARGSTGR